MNQIESSYDTLGYQEISLPIALSRPLRVFALKTPGGYDLYEYVWKDVLVTRLGFPSETALIGNAPTERTARKKLIDHLEKKIREARD